MQRIVQARHVVAIACLVAAAGPSLGAAPGAINWRTDYYKARQEAQTARKILLVSIHTAWCPPCKMMERTTLQDPAVVQLINETCIPLHLDGDHDGRVISQWAITGYPTELFVAPNGAIAGRLEGYKDVGSYIASLQQAVAYAGVTRQAPAVAQSTPRDADANSQGVMNADRKETAAAPASRRPGDAPIAGASSSAGADSSPVALQGYCPVSMISRAVLIAGEESESLEFKGRRYVFSSKREREMFQANPDRFLPAENGSCVVTWAEEKRWSSGRIEYPALYGEHVYLFSDEAHRQKFLLDPERYVDQEGRAYRTTFNSDRAGSSTTR